jgi:hypothetical protein
MVALALWSLSTYRNALKDGFFKDTKGELALETDPFSIAGRQKFA